MTEIEKFMSMKMVKVMLKDVDLSSSMTLRLNTLFGVYSATKTYDMHRTICFFILNDLTNYLGRYKRLKGIPGTSKYTTYLRYGRKGITIYKNACIKKTISFKNTKDFYNGQGLTEEEIKHKISLIQTKRGELAAKKLKGTSEYSCRSRTYWKKQGLSEEEIDKKIKMIQTTNGKKWYIKKYGKEQGLLKFEKRIIKWKKTLNDKSQEEKDLMNLKKGWSVNGLKARGFSEEMANKIYLEKCNFIKNLAKPYSKISQELFFRIQKEVSGKMFFAEFGGERYINMHAVDFFHEETRICVEFHGDFWHMNPKKYLPGHIGFNGIAKEKWMSDKNREDSIRPHVSELVIIWESDYIKDKDKITNDLIIKIKDKQND